MINKKFSIIITTKNRYKLLTEELNCLVDQTYRNFEVIIIDDLSTDETKSLNIEQYKIYFPINIYHSDMHLNMVKARNKGIQLANKKTDYFVILDDDNKFDNDYLEKFNIFLNQYPNFGIIGSKNYHLDKKTIWYFGCNYNLSTLLPKFHRKEFREDYLKVDAVANSFFIKKDLFDKIAYFDPNYVIDFSESEYCYRHRSSA